MTQHIPSLSSLPVTGPLLFVQDFPQLNCIFLLLVILKTPLWIVLTCKINSNYFALIPRDKNSAIVVIVTVFLWTYSCWDLYTNLKNQTEFSEVCRPGLTILPSTSLPEIKTSPLCLFWSLLLYRKSSCPSQDELFLVLEDEYSEKKLLPRRNFATFLHVFILAFCASHSEALPWDGQGWDEWEIHW